MRFWSYWKSKLLSESETRYELALRGANISTWDWNVKTGHVVYNDRWAEMRGYKLSEIKPSVEAFFKSVHPEDAPNVELALNNHFTKNLPYDTSFRVATKSGDWLWVWGCGRVFERDANGDPIRMCGTEMDITGLKRIESEIYRASFVTDNLPSMIAYWDRDQICRFANKAYHSWFGRSPVGLNAQELLGPALYQKNLPHIEGVLRGETQVFERNLEMQSNGSVRHIQVQYVPDIANGKVNGFSSLVTDVTDIKNATMEAIAAKKDREDILSIVSHDLKSPLSVQLMTAEMLLQEESPSASEVHQMCERIKRTTMQMQTLIDDLLDFGNIQSGTFSIKRQREPAAKLITHVCESMHPLAEAKKQILKVEIAQNLPDLDCDFKRISQVLSNVIGNAIKFTPEGGQVTVTVSADALDVLVSVTDSGPGIQAGDLTKVFDRFWQAPTTIERGSGLGLSIAKSIMTAHGSMIWAESDGKNGSKFSLLVPSHAKVAPSFEK